MHPLKTRHISVFEYINCNPSLRKVSLKHGLTRSTLSRWVELERQGDVRKYRKAYERRKPSKSSLCTPYVKHLLNDDAFAHVDDIRRAIESSTGALVSRSTIARCRKNTGFTFKLASRSQDHQRANLDHAFFSVREVYDENTISVDESGFVSCDSSRRGWALRGRHVFKHPPKNRKRVSLLLAMSRSGVVASAIRPGSFKSDSFATFLRTLPPGKRVLLDNASIHKSAVVRDAARDMSLSLVYTPPYCPWFNPVEHAFSVTKSWYRRKRVLSTQPFEEDVLLSLSRLTSCVCNGCFDGGQNAKLREMDEA
jgi:transposase